MRKLYAAKLCSCILLFVTWWTAAHQASLSVTISQSLLKLMFSKSSCYQDISSSAIPLLPSIFPNTRVFSNEPALCIRWSECWSFSFSPKWIFRTHFLLDWLVWSPCSPRTLSHLQHHNSKSLILCRSAFFMVQHSHP